MPGEAIGVIDIGKTHARLLVVEGDTGALLWSHQRECRPRSGPIMRELDTHGLESWLVSALREVPDKARIRTLVPVAHGAAAVLLDVHGNQLLAPDYEDPTFETTAERYRPLRDAFADTFSPFLPLGLNLGRQFHHVQTLHPQVWNRIATILLYPQHWAWRFSGVAASELTSLGCHSDLWRPVEHRYSDLALQRGWANLLPPLRKPHEVLGSLTPAMAAATGLDSSCRVICGIHDSNASYLCHLAGRQESDSFAVVSSGTWTVIMAHGAQLSVLNESEDMLANVDARGQATATARFMGGREFQMIAGTAGAQCEPTSEDLDAVLDCNAMALPCFSAGGGPFAGRKGRLVGVETLLPVERAALATVYVALMTDLLLDRLQAACDVVVDGPLARNRLFGQIMASWRPTSDILQSDDGTGSITAARVLAGYQASAQVSRPDPSALPAARLAAYRTEWREHVAANTAAS